ncbi:tellurite resistance/C4-dicarboxylate transporter family protein [Desulfotomaculum copahuensis]|nr:tellurite resistance/C4-dicarboxylate transporter family protein [Desulfotomaculum copahuensis]
MRLNLAKEHLRRLYPGHFTLVLATTVLSLGTFDLGLFFISNLFWYLAVLFFLVLVVLYLFRLLLNRKGLLLEATDPVLMFNFFCFVTACNILGIRAASGCLFGLSLLLLVTGALSWIFFLFITIAALIMYNQQPLPKAVNGSWLMLVVGTQSLVILSTLVLAKIGFKRTFCFLSTSLWLAGIFFYLIIILFILIKFFFSRINPENMAPSYWVGMGAASISAVAGMTILNTGGSISLVIFLRPFIMGMVLLLWAWATWWIPLLLLIGFWRHVCKRYSFKPDPAFWSIVFPVGMYALACLSMGTYFQMEWLRNMGRIAVWTGLLAWVAVWLNILFHPGRE